jgi:hypothetical protein
VLALVLAYGGEAERVNFHSQSGDVLLLELSSQVTLDEGGLAAEKSAIGSNTQDRHR